MTTNGNTAKVFLRPDIVIEPLVDQWYAWSHILAPHTGAMNMLGRHIRLMESYVSAPQVHAAAARNPAMRGGPFLEYPQPRVAEIRELLDRTVKGRAHMVMLAKAIKQADQLLQQQARGHSLEPLYRELPQVLSGYVELVYDLNNHPSVRFLEPLLYRSWYYERSAQSLMISRIPCDDRPFILSTPRLEDESSCHLRISFDDPFVDRLYSMTREGRPLPEVTEQAAVPEKDRALFESFFTEQPPPHYQPPPEGLIRWRYFGHACVLLEVGPIAILVDPILSYTHEHGISRYTYMDLPPRIDYVLITHNHQDHVLFETLLQIRQRVGTIVVPRSGGGSLQDPSLKHLLRNCGFPCVVEVDEMDTIEIEGGAITSIPFFGEHADLDIRAKTGYHVRLGPHTLLLLADSCNLEPRLYELIHGAVGDVDVLFVGMECDGAPMSWIYGCLLSAPMARDMDQSRRLSGSDFNRALDIINRFHCRYVYVYAMGLEPWLGYISSIRYTDRSKPIVESDRLIAACRERGLVAERLYGEKELRLS